MVTVRRQAAAVVSMHRNRCRIVCWLRRHVRHGIRMLAGVATVLSASLMRARAMAAGAIVLGGSD